MRRRTTILGHTISRIYLCDSANGYRLLTLNATEQVGGGIYSAKVIFSNDGRRIAANNWLGEITIWEIDNQEFGDSQQATREH